ncbi:MAG: phosphotransferase, partial [Lewinella sp.]|nr:phosphotransferase [Lewinella sp.]
VVDPSAPGQILAVLDWEMASLGDPLTDLGTTLAYWAMATDDPLLRPFNLTWLPGNLNRQEVLDYYGQQSGIDTTDFLFYYLLGNCKVAVICQQIYARYCRGTAADPRFAGLGRVVKALAAQGRSALERGYMN